MYILFCVIFSDLLLPQMCYPFIILYFIYYLSRDNLSTQGINVFVYGLKMTFICIWLKHIGHEYTAYACAKMVIEQLQDTFESSIHCVSKTTGKHNLVFLVKNKNESSHVYSTSNRIKVNISFESLYNMCIYLKNKIS